MKAITARLEKLEAALMPSGIVVLALQTGEDREDGIRRHGYNLEARGMTFIFADEADQRA